MNTRFSCLQKTLGILALACLCALPPARAEVQLTLTGPDRYGPIVPDANGDFVFTNVALRRNSADVFTVTAVDEATGQRQSAEVAITQVSMDNVVVSRITTERLSVEEVEKLVQDGVIDLENPENYNVSQFTVVLTIANEPVPVSVPIAIPKEEPLPSGYETYRLPFGRDSGGSPPPAPIEIVVFMQEVEEVTEGGAQVPPIPGVILIEGKIRSLKEFFSVRLMLMNASGIFTLSDVKAEIEYPDGGLTSILPQDGIVSFGDILPGNADQPGQKEKEFIVRGDEMGVRRVRVNYGGQITGPGIPTTNAIPFNGSAQAEIEVKGPPRFRVALNHPDYVWAGVPYDLTVEIRNDGELTAMYASLELDVGADAELVNCVLTTNQAGETDLDCEYIKNSVTRNFGHISPGKSVVEVFTVMPLKEGRISSCMGISDQNIALEVMVGNLGCLTGYYPAEADAPPGVPVATVMPFNKAQGVSVDSPVVALFTENMNTSTITTGEGGSFNVFTKAGERVPGVLRHETLSGRAASIWQVEDGVFNRLQPNTEYSVYLTRDIKDPDGNPLYNEWISTFRTTGMGSSDVTPPTVTLSVEPPTDPNYILPGEIITLGAYAADQGSGVSRVELRLRDLDGTNQLYTLVDSRSVFAGDTPPYRFALDSSKLTTGHVYSAMATAFDAMGNWQNAAVALVMAPNADPPVLVLPDDPALPWLQGIGVTLRPIALTGGVRQVRYFLDEATNAYKTVTLPPWQASLSTLNLALTNHRIRAVATDGLGQTGLDVYEFLLVENLNMPTVGFSGAQSGAVFIEGQPVSVHPIAEDPVGLGSVHIWIEGPVSQMLTTNLQPILLQGVPLGDYRVVICATNQLGIANDLSDSNSWFAFSVVEPPPGPPPAPPVVALGYPDNGAVAFTGQSVAHARIEVVNTNRYLQGSVQADAAGAFSGVMPAAAGETLTFTAWDLANSPFASTATVKQVQDAPTLVDVSVSPADFTLNTAGATRDLSVQGWYTNSFGGWFSNLTSRAIYTSTNPACASVSSAGRVVALARGRTDIRAAFGGLVVTSRVFANIITLTNLAVTPAAPAFVAIGETIQLDVRGQYNDGHEADVRASCTFLPGDVDVVRASAAGLLTAVGDGATPLTVYYPGFAPKQVPLTVNSGEDPPPTAQIVSPADEVQVQRGESLSVSVRATDVPLGVAQVFLSVTGAMTHAASQLIAPPAKRVTPVFGCTVSPDAPLGGWIYLRAWSVDVGGHTSETARARLRVADTIPPDVRLAAPPPESAFKYGEAVTVTVSASDAGGLDRVRYFTLGALSFSETRTLSGAPTSTNVDFAFVIPSDVPYPDVYIYATARDVSGNERTNGPLSIIISDADNTPPATEIYSASAPGTETTSLLSYRVTDGADDLDHVEIYFRRDGYGTFNRYTDADGDNPQGRYTPSNGVEGTVLFDSTKMGSDGRYEFYSVGVDTHGNREAAPLGTNVALTNWVLNTTADFSAAQFNTLEIFDHGTIVGLRLPTNSWPFAWRRPVAVVNSNAQNLSEFQVCIVLDSANFDFTRTRADGADIRFADSTLTRRLEHWIESWDAGGQAARVWVAMPWLPAASTQSIWMLYGNSAAPDASLIGAAFEYGEDFSSTNLTQWTFLTEGSGTVQYGVTNGALRLFGEGGVTLYALPSNANAFADYVFEVDVTPLDNNAQDVFTINRWRDMNNLYIHGYCMWESPHTAVIGRRSGGGWAELANAAFTIETNRRDQWSVRLSGSSHRLWVNGSQRTTANDGTHLSGRIGLGLDPNYGSSPDEALFDNLRVRKFAAEDPVAFVGVESAFNQHVGRNAGRFVSAAAQVPALTRYSSLSWTGAMPAGAAITLWLRAASNADGLAAAPWYGPAGTNAGYAAWSGTLNSNLFGCTWVQARVDMRDSNGLTVAQAPYLDWLNLRVAYDGLSPDWTTHFAAGTAWTVITQNTSIAEGDMAYDGRNLRVSGATLTLSGAHSFQNVEFINGATLTHPAATTGEVYGVQLSAWTFTVASNSSVNADNLGYLGARRGANNTGRGRTLDNAPGSTPRSGGSYGGEGGAIEGTPNVVYGNLVMPADLGSGGSEGSYSYAGGNGGGRVAINAINIALDGTIRADGGTGAGYGAGSGSGGSVYLAVSSISGRGLARANGGGNEVGGGGGRVAVHYVDMANIPSESFTALGGQGNTRVGGNGTVFLRDLTEGGGTLIVDGQGAASTWATLPIPPGYVFDNIIIRNNARVILDDPLIVSDKVTIATGSILTHSLGNTNGIFIQARRLELDATSSIDATAKGYRGGRRDGNANPYGLTLAGQPGSVYRSGGAFGGYGAVLDGAGCNAAYGTPYAPVYLGAGGSEGSYSYAGGNGGGRVTLRVSHSVLVHGQILAVGGTGNGYGAGSGSGGSVWIETLFFHGTGTVNARGGAGETGGGGGRIRIDYTYWGVPGDDFNGTRSITAAGGDASSSDGSAGTVLLVRDGQTYGDLFLDEGRASTHARWAPLTIVGPGTVTALSDNELVGDGGVAFLPHALAGLRLNPNLEQDTTFEILDNTATSIVVALNPGASLTNVAAVGDHYAALYRFDNATLRGGAFALWCDPVRVENDLWLAEAAQLTHRDTDLTYIGLLDLHAGAVIISTNSSMDAGGRGYLGGRSGANAGFSQGRTEDNALGSVYRSGGSYGGRGAVQDGAGSATAYGSWTAPAHPGGGGSEGAYSYRGGDGGGQVRIVADTVVVDGSIRSDGDPGTGYRAGSGAGGAIHIVAGEVGGTGTISARGGTGETGGGGGRIAIVGSGPTLELDGLTITAAGGAGSYVQGGAGTIYTRVSTQAYGSVCIDAANLSVAAESTPYLGGAVFDDLELRNGAQVVANVPVVLSNTLSVVSGASLTHSLEWTAGLDVRARNVFVGTNAAMEVSAKGYRGGRRDGNANGYGLTLDWQAGSVYRSGGSYGGLGGVQDGAGCGPVYGSPYEPVHLGSGGSEGAYSYAGGNGGGRITLRAESVTVEGAIRANGQTGNGYHAGSGSGGAIWIETSLLQGNGAISADGAAHEVGGGGGRIRIDYETTGASGYDFNELRAVTALGGSGSGVHGSAGTVLLVTPAMQYGRLVIAAGRIGATAARWTPLPPLGVGRIAAVWTNGFATDGGVSLLPGALEGLTVQPNTARTNLFRIAGNTATSVTIEVSSGFDLSGIAQAGAEYALVYSFDSALLRDGAYLVMGDRLRIGGEFALEDYSMLTHHDATTAYEPSLDLRAGRIAMGSNSAINVTGRGYLGARQSGNPNGHGLAWSNQPGSTYRSGGSHGGLGGIVEGIPNPLYGSSNAPATLGAGGSEGSYSYPGGDGGGRAHIVSPEIVLDGAIVALGNPGHGYHAGSGAGGSLFIETAALSGRGTVYANGGAGEVGGGGGRVAVYYNAASSSIGSLAFTAAGGSGSSRVGQNGTVVLDGGYILPPANWGPAPLLPSFATPHVFTLSDGAAIVLYVEPPADGVRRVNTEGEAAAQYAIDYTEDLMRGTWLRVGYALPGQAWTGAAPVAQSGGFYRLRLEP